MDIANAPVSFGVFDLASATKDGLPGADDVCRILSKHDYAGIDLGPVGYLGRGEELRQRLNQYGLTLAGGWIDLPFSDDTAFPEALPSLSEALDVFAEATAGSTGPLPLPTLADSGSARRQAHPGGGPGLCLDSEGWSTLARNVQVAARMVRERGFEPTFHHHACTHVETPEEIERFLEVTDVNLTLDTGHLILGGGDPVRDLKLWRDRINHIHIKDARIDVLRSVLKGGGDMRDVLAARGFVPLGTGDLDLEAFMGELIDSGYDGWLIVEQDKIAQPGEQAEASETDLAINRTVLRKWIP